MAKKSARRPRYVARPSHRKKCGFKCLFGSCAEASSPFLADEIGDFAAALPAGHPIHIGVYWSGYSSCGTPSPKYNWDSFVTALALPSVAGVTVYADLVSTYKHKGQYKDCLMVKNGSVIPLSIDKGCLVKHPLSVMCVCAESSAERRLYVRMYGHIYALKGVINILMRLRSRFPNKYISFCTFP